MSDACIIFRSHMVRSSLWLGSSVVLFASCVAALASCRGGGGGGGSDADAGRDSGIDLHTDGGLSCNPATSMLNVGQTEQLSVAGAGSAPLTWSSGSPDVADVSANGLVTAKGAGTASVLAAGTNGAFGICEVTVTSGCSDVAMVNDWAGALTLDLAASASGSTTFSLSHHFSVTFDLAKDPNPPVGSVQWIGQPAGMGMLQESEVISGGASVSQTGNGSVSSVGDFTLTLDTTSCTYTFEWLWALDTTYAVSGSSMPVPQVNIGDVKGAPTPVNPGWATTGLTVSGMFPAWGMQGAGASPPIYIMLTQIAQAFTSANPGSQGPARVTFVAAPKQ